MKESAIVLRKLYVYLRPRYDAMMHNIESNIPGRVNYYDKHAARLQNLKTNMETRIPMEIDIFVTSDLPVEDVGTRENIFGLLVEAEDVVRLYENWRSLPGFIPQGYKHLLPEGRGIT